MRSLSHPRVWVDGPRLTTPGAYLVLCDLCLTRLRITSLVVTYLARDIFDQQRATHDHIYTRVRIRLDQLGRWWTHRASFGDAAAEDLPRTRQPQ